MEMEKEIKEIIEHIKKFNFTEEQVNKIKEVLVEDKKNENK